jgi:hypothetical protein
MWQASALCCFVSSPRLGSHARFFFPLFCFYSGWQWSIPGGIGISLEKIYGISDYTTQMLLNYGLLCSA